MASDAQNAANRRNAQRSTGPKSDEGKARSSQNATTHGFYSSHLLVPGEDQALLDQHANELLEELQPLSTLEMMLFERALIASWKFRRSMRIVQDLYTDQSCDDAVIIASLLEKQELWQEKLQKQMDRACNQLRKLQRARREQEQSTQKQMEQMAAALGQQTWSEPPPVQLPPAPGHNIPPEEMAQWDRFMDAMRRGTLDEFVRNEPNLGLSPDSPRARAPQGSDPTSPRRS